MHNHRSKYLVPLFILLFLFIFASCSNQSEISIPGEKESDWDITNLSKISKDELLSMKEDNQEFYVYFGRPSCIDCLEFYPKFKDILVRNDTLISLPESITDNTDVLTGNDGTVLYNNTDKKTDAELAVQAINDENIFEGIRISMIINNASADHEYDFKLKIPENHKIVTSYDFFDGKLDTGELLVLDENNVISQIICAPWAKDAKGNDVDTEYVLEGNTIKQVVHFDKNTAFPVVADPSILEDLKCAATLALYVTGVKAGFAVAKTVVKIVKNAGSIKNATKAIYAVVKARIQKKSKKEQEKAIRNAIGVSVAISAGLREFILDVIGISDIKKYCVTVVY